MLFSTQDAKKFSQTYFCLSDRNGTRTHNHLVRKQTSKNLAKLGRFG